MMLSNIPAIGACFGISKLESPSYGQEAWKLFWDVIDPFDIPASVLYEGDVHVEESLYCIAIQSLVVEKLIEAKKKLEASAEFRRAGAGILQGQDVLALPLIKAGTVSAFGTIEKS